MLSFLPILAHASIDISKCNADTGLAFVTLTGASGKWVSFHAKTSVGKIIDVSPKKKSKFGFAGFGASVFNFGLDKGVTHVRSVTLDTYDKKTKKVGNILDDTGWITCED